MKPKKFKMPETSFEKSVYYAKAAFTLHINNAKYAFSRKREAFMKRWHASPQLITQWVPKPLLLTKDEDERQSHCQHLKGGYHQRRRFFALDYAITDHTFIDGSRKVWCQLCKKTWLPGSWGWKRDVPFMLANTTNTCTSSEIPVGAVKPKTLRGSPAPKHNSYQYHKYPPLLMPVTAAEDAVKNQENWKKVWARVLCEAIKIMTWGS